MQLAMEKSISRALVSCLTFAVMTALALATPVGRAAGPFHFYGDSSLGWGSTPSSFANPGPTISVTEGDNVTMVLNSTDGQRHNWFVDYDDDGSDGGTEPNSPFFRNEEITWTFLADRNGTFTYRCRFHPDTMTGQITITQAGALPPWPFGQFTSLVLLAVVAVAVAVVVAILFSRRRPSERPSGDDITEDD